jgi:ribosomal protein S12 methylthiotransferase accessory factor
MTTAASDVIDALERLERLRADVLARRTVVASEISQGALHGALRDLGITRVGNLTELDRLAIPVWSAVRPASRSLCVSNGKGITDEAAWISAVMESAEQALAERAGRVVSLIESTTGLARRGLRSVPLHRQSRCASVHLDPDEEMAWVRGISWATGETVYAPYELVGMDMASTAPWNYDQFRVTSLGLASGADLLRAMLHGLSELVEDDASFAPITGRLATPSRGPLPLSNRHTALVDVLDQLAQEGVEARFADLTDDIDVPMITAALRPTEASDDDLAYFGGRSCRSVREDAALAALLEAAQSRLTFISGARDDLFPTDYSRPLKAGTKAMFGAYELVDAPIRRPAADEALRELAGMINALGLDIYAFPLGGSDLGIEAVRVLADDLISLEGPKDHARSGRAARKLLQQWGQPA